MSLMTFVLKVAVVNLDPANETMPYKASVDLSDLISLSDVMDSLKLGPNGGLVSERTSAIRPKGISFDAR